jgi:hypothetical protein
LTLGKWKESTCAAVLSFFLHFVFSLFHVDSIVDKLQSSRSYGVRRLQ